MLRDLLHRLKVDVYDAAAAAQQTLQQLAAAGISLDEVYSAQAKAAVGFVNAATPSGVPVIVQTVVVNAPGGPRPQRSKPAAGLIAH